MTEIPPDAIRLQLVEPIDMDAWRPPTYDAVGEPVTAVNQCSICFALVRDRPGHDDYHRNLAEVVAVLTNAMHARGVMPFSSIDKADTTPSRFTAKCAIRTDDEHYQDGLGAVFLSLFDPTNGDLAEPYLQCEYCGEYTATLTEPDAIKFRFVGKHGPLVGFDLAARTARFGQVAGD